MDKITFARVGRKKVWLGWNKHWLWGKSLSPFGLVIGWNTSDRFCGVPSIPWRNLFWKVLFLNWSLIDVSTSVSVSVSCEASILTEVVLGEQLLSKHRCQFTTISSIRPSLSCLLSPSRLQVFSLKVMVVFLNLLPFHFTPKLGLMLIEISLSPAYEVWVYSVVGCRNNGQRKMPQPFTSFLQRDSLQSFTALLASLKGSN